MSTPVFASLFDGADTESESFEDPIDTKTPESPLTVAPPTSLLESTPPTLVLILCRTARMAVRVPPAMSSGLSDSMAEGRQLCLSPVHKRTQRMRVPIEDEDPAVRDEVLLRGMRDLREEEEAVPGVVAAGSSGFGDSVSAPLRLGYIALRRRELAFEEDHVYSTFKGFRFKIAATGHGFYSLQQADMIHMIDKNVADVNHSSMSKSAYRKRFRSSYESSSSSSPPDLPSRKRYQGTSELVEDSEEDDDEEDEKIEESLDSESVSEDTEDEGPTAGDESLAAGDKGPGMDDESHGFDDESRGLDNEGHSVESDGFGLEEEEEAVPGGQQQAAPVVGTAVTPPVQTLPSPEWTFGSLLISPSYSVVPSPMISQTVPSPVATPATAETEGFLTEPGAQVDMQGGLIRDHAVQLEELSPALFKRYQFWSLEYEQEMVAVTFGAIWRPVLALESWAGQTDAHRAALWHAISDMHGENRDLWLQLTKERHARLELAEVVDSMRIGQEPRGDA
ncbi:hypothetical protein Tco_0781886 [Tanacetum coccineum]